MVNLQEEKERLAREKKEEKERLAKEKAAEKERVAKEKEEKERSAKEMEDRNPSDEEEGPKPQLEQQWKTRPDARIVKIIRTENGQDNSRDSDNSRGAAHTDQENEGE